jgi:hypothetical protein
MNFDEKGNEIMHLPYLEHMIAAIKLYSVQPQAGRQHKHIVQKSKENLKKMKK